MRMSGVPDTVVRNEWNFQRTVPRRFRYDGAVNRALERVARQAPNALLIGTPIWSYPPDIALSRVSKHKLSSYRT